MKPIVFGQTVGWFHPAAGSRGVVIAGAHGFEDLCSRRFLSLMAKAFAKAGLPVLQFDYPGCGDAAGDHAEPARAAAWIASIGEAIDQLKARSGAADVLLVGFRLGALLCSIAAAGRNDVAGLALLAPPASGKTYMRETAGLARMIDGALPAHPGAEPFDGVEAAGFRMSPETAADLRKLEWRDAAANLAADLLLVPQQVAPFHGELAEQAAARGSKVRVETFAGFANLMSSPTANDIPQAVLELVVGWAEQRARPSGGRFRPAAGNGSRWLKSEGYKEQPLVLGPAPEICGVLCMPAEARPEGEVALILNAGAIPHVGWARGAVEMARSLAGRGISSMRIDLPGLGQSGTPEEKRVFLYDEGGRSDVIRVVDWLAQYGFDRVCAIGTCAGAYQAFHSARQDRRIAHLAMVNPLCFAWNGSYALDMELSKIRDNARSAARPGDDGRRDEGQSADGPAAHRSGALKAKASRLARSSLRFCMELAKSATSALWRRLSFGSQSVERWMRDLTSGGTRVLLVSGENDRSLDEIARHFGRGGERFKRLRGASFALLLAADHTLTPVHARAELLEHVAELMGSATAPQPGKRAKEMQPANEPKGENRGGAAAA